MSTSPDVPFIRTYLANHGVELALIATALEKRKQHGKPAFKEHLSPAESAAYSTYKKARDEYRQTDEYRASLLAEFDRITPSLQAVSDADFDTAVLSPEGGTLVQFFARWCGPCHAAGEVLEKVAQAGHRIAKLDCEASAATAKRFAIRSYPTLVLFERGGLRGVYRGERTPELISEWLNGKGRIRTKVEQKD